MRPFIRWAGSKKQLLNKLRLYWPGGSTRYIEPFCGSASLFFDIQPRSAVLGDLNKELVSTLLAVQRDVRSVIDCLELLPEGKDPYYIIRGWDRQDLSKIEAAARFLYLNHYCFNGLYRTDLKGRFNVPLGKSRSKKPFDVALLTAGAKALSTATIIQGDFEQTLAMARPGDFVYLDPPYIVKSRRVFSEYWKGSFCNEDLQRLALSLRQLNDKGIYFLITYADSAEARRLLAPWHYRRIRTRRNIAGFAGARRNAYELLANNITELPRAR